MNSHYYLVGFSALITLNVRPLPDPFSMFAVFIPFYFSVSQGSGFCPYRGKVLSRVLHFIDRKRPSPCKQYLGQNGE